MKVTTDSCFFGAWCAEEMSKLPLNGSRLLDIGTGTGLLPLMIAQKNKLLMDAVEIDKEAASQAKENIASSPWPDQITVYNKNILRFDPKKQYDFIISNPPFYENELSSGLQARDMAHHSSELKMDQVISIIKERLRENGRFFLLLPFKREKEIETLTARDQLYVQNKILLRPSPEQSPSRIILMGSKKRQDATSLTVSIRDQTNEYTGEFNELLKDYYLYL
jgi:tRNA1Val (adenine37-N6)-methyltransferase